MRLVRKRSGDGRSAQLPRPISEHREALGCMQLVHSVGESVVLAKSKYPHRK
jgi:hypothetical protein